MSFKPPIKKLGQHFLQDRSAIDRIVAALAPRSGEPLLEIGPGRGALTRALVAATDRLAAVELDRDLARRLRERFGAAELIVVEGDVLQIRFATFLERLEAAADRRLVIAGNLPYNISQPIAHKLVRERDAVERAVLMFQQEVAQRLVAPPGSRDYGPLGILAGTVYDIRRLFDLPPGAFRPVPKVISTVTVWTRRAADPLDPALERALGRCLRVSFARRRKTLRNNLRAAAVDDAELDRFLDGLGIDGTQRAETLPPRTFLRMARRWKALAAG